MRFENKSRAIPSDMTGGYKGRETYPITVLNIENSFRTKYTWCNPRCLNTVHEGAGDECEHEKLRADRFHMRCKYTSLLASSEATRTPPKTESWVAAWLEFFFRPTSELLLTISEDGDSLLDEEWSGRARWLVASWPKTNRRRTRARVLLSSKGCGA
jgi:hypothetical protein